MSPTNTWGAATAQGLSGENPATPTQNSGNFFERLLPTAGGILGGIGGAVLGGGIGGVGGAAAGDTAGRALENIFTHQNVKDDLGSSAVQGALGQAGGSVLGSIGGKVLGSLVSPAADKLSTAALQGQFKGTLDATTAKTLSDMGITDARQVSQIAPLITQGNGALSTGVKTALDTSADNGAGIDITGLDNMANNTMLEHGFQNPRTADTVGHNLTQSMNRMTGEDAIPVTGSSKTAPLTFAYTPGSLTHALPGDVFKESQKMDQLASQSYNKAYDKMGTVVNSDELTKGKVYSQMADELQSRAFGTQEGGNPLALTQEAKDAIINQLAPVKDINPDVYNHYVSQVSQAKTVQELRPLQASMVNASKALESSQRIAANGGALTGADIARGGVGLATNPIKAAAGMVLNQPVTDRAAASGLDKIAGLTSKNSALVSKIVPLASRAAGVAGANLPNDIPPETNSAIPSNMPVGGAMQGVQPVNTYNSVIQQMLNESALLGDSQFGAGTAQSANSLLGGALPQIQKNQLLSSSLAGLPTAFGAAGGGQGLGGIMSRLTGLVQGTPANAFENQAGATAAQLAATLGISPQAAEALLPQLMQSQGIAGNRLSLLGSLQGGLGGATSAIPAQ